MFTQPISDTTAIAIDDADENSWSVHIVDFKAQAIESFSVDGVGSVQSVHYDNTWNLIWIISDGKIFAIKRLAKQMFDIDMPEESFFAYSMIGEGSHVYVSGEYSNLWRMALPAMEWEPLLTPEPKSSESDVTGYAGKHPPYYSGFKVGEDYVFCGAIGALARVRGGAVETKTIGSNVRLVRGQLEGNQISLSADSPKGEIYLGTFDEGFKPIFSDNLRAFHRTALHDGHRYIGVAEYPPSRVHNLYLQKVDEQVPVKTGCAREPMPLISLAAIGNTLWAIDQAGIFQLSDGKWTLVDVDDLRGGAWPQGS